MCTASLSIARLRDQLRQMRKWQKQYGNRADPRQHVGHLSLSLLAVILSVTRSNSRNNVSLRFVFERIGK